VTYKLLPVVTWKKKLSFGKKYDDETKNIEKNY